MKPRSHTLFHFTKNMDFLKNILINGFFPRYVLEDFSWYNPETGFIGYPMVCFCDIPLTRIDEHVDFYGNYGLGLTRNWAIQNRLSPVIYFSPASDACNAFSRLCLTNQTSIGGYYAGSFDDANSILSYIKPIEGSALVGGKPVLKEFYQENEWRYVPKSAHIPQWISKEDHLNPLKIISHNEIAKNTLSLKITPNDIKYIFVKTDSEIPTIIDLIQEKLGNFPANDLKVLISRVISLENIKSDL